MRQRLKNTIHRFRPKALVLMYHRITSLAIDPWQLAVTADHFDQHLEVLKKIGPVISTCSLVEQLRTKKLKDHSIVITFDDGYFDNYENAFPLLKKHGLPATFFITTSQLGKKTEFWWDALESIIIHTPSLPGHISISMHGITIDYALQDEVVLTDATKKALENWRALENQNSKRSRLYELLWQQMRPLSSVQQEDILAYLQNWAGHVPERKENYAMSEASLKEMASHPLITVGGHTETHPDLACHKKDYQEYEVTENKKRLSNITGIPPECFAYPYGRYNQESTAAVKASGYKAAFTTNTSIVKTSNDLYLLNRVQVPNCSGEELHKTITNYFRYPVQ
jgi:peptidoglycan/xylan/chitin deacetylase (PgdA/CDA1 family)